MAVEGRPEEVIGRESIRQLYGIGLDVAEIDGQEVCPDCLKKE